jgi:Undecaprenyl-phosphate glucose phosphotransferase
MLKKHSQLTLALMLAFDALVILIAWTLAYVLRFEVRFDLFGLINFPPEPAERWEYLHFMPVVLAIQLLANIHFNLYEPRRVQRVFIEFLDIIKAAFALWVAMLAILYLFHRFAFSRYVLTFYLILFPLLLIITRGAVRGVLMSMRKRGRNIRRAIIVGAGKLGQALHENIIRNPWTGIHVVAYLDDRDDRIGKNFRGAPVESIKDLKRVIAEKDVDQVFIALPFDKHLQMRETLDALTDEMVDVRLVPDFFSFTTLRKSVTDFEGIPILNMRESPLAGWSAVLKRLLDITTSFAALTALATPMMLIALMVKLTSKGPVFYKQERMGLDGHRFNILKFRSMRADAEKETGAVWAKKNDPRRTWLGAFLRKTSLDELPQLINVLKGDMSIVGPRPERPVLIEEFKKQVPRYMLRHKTKAGITGWAQVNGWRGDSSLLKRIQYDIYYIENWSIWFDIRIMFMTLYRGFASRSAY